MSSDPLRAGGVWGRDYLTDFSISPVSVSICTKLRVVRNKLDVDKLFNYLPLWSSKGHEQTGDQYGSDVKRAEFIAR